MRNRIIIAVLLSAAVLYGAIVNGYMDFVLRSAPSNPASGNARVYVDSGTNLLTCILHSGASCMPSAGGSHADAEVPSGTLDGSNVTFTLVNSPSPANSLQLYLNGVLQVPGTDFTLSGSTITYTIAPNKNEGGDNHIAWYRY